MAEYIEREAAIKCIEGQCVDGKMWGNDESEGTLIEAYSAIDDLMEIPSADVAPVRHGRWISVKNPQWPAYSHDQCGICGWWNTKNAVCRDGGKYNRAHSLNYCPNCGAKMDLVEDEDHG